MVRIYIIVALAVAAFIASGTAYFFYEKGSLNQVIAAQKVDNSKITQDLIVSREDTQRAVQANTALWSTVFRMREDAEMAAREVEELRKASEDADARLAEEQARLADTKRDERMDEARKTRASLLLERMNADVACRMENFGRVDGRCVGGRWRDGVRH